MVIKKNKHCFGFSLCLRSPKSSEPSCLSPKVLLTWLPAFSQFPPLQLLRIQFCFPQRQMKILTENSSLGQEILTTSPHDLIFFLYFLCHQNEKLQKSTPRQLNVLILSLYFSQGIPVLILAHSLMDRTLTPLRNVKSPLQFGYSNHFHSRVFPGRKGRRIGRRFYY